MADTSPILSLPYLAPSQAQKHVTHNEALQRLDILVQLRVQEFDATQPPAVPGEGEVYATGTGALAAWAGHDGQLAAFTDGAWLFIDPLEGWTATDVATGEGRVWQTGAWVALPLDNLDSLGIATTADATNRLAVASGATLFTHDGAGHQMKLNKAAPGDTGTLLFQTGWSGRAEMGLAGDDNWSIKVSDDGASWQTALRINAATGAVGIGLEPNDHYELSVVALSTEPTILVHNTGGSAGAAFRVIDDLSGGDWKFKITGNGSFKLRDQADGVDCLYLHNTTRSADFAGAVRPATYGVATLPDAVAVGAGGIIYVSDEAGGPVLAFSDGTDWRRSTDRAVVS